MEEGASDEMEGRGGNRQKARGNPSGPIPTHWDEHYNSAAKEYPRRKGYNPDCYRCRAERIYGAAEPL